MQSWPVAIGVGNRAAQVLELGHRLKGDITNLEGDMVGLIGGLLGDLSLHPFGSLATGIGIVMLVSQHPRRHLTLTPLTFGVGGDMVLQYMDGIHTVTVLEVRPQTGGAVEAVGASGVRAFHSGGGDARRAPGYATHAHWG